MFKWCRGYMSMQSTRVGGRNLASNELHKHKKRWLVVDPDLWKAESDKFTKQRKGYFEIKVPRMVKRFKTECNGDCSMEIPYGEGFFPGGGNPYTGTTFFDCYQKE